MTAKVIEVKGLKNCFGTQWVHKDVTFDVNQGEIVALIGGSGCGKTTVLRSLLLLQQPTGGEISVFNQDLFNISEQSLLEIRKNTGMLFQQSALFSGFSILENVMFPLQNFTDLPKSFIEELALFKLLLVGLSAKDANKMPSELSGGMQKRVAAARALALDPELLFLDEPVAGLDPKSAKGFDELLLFLRAQLKITIVMVSHDLLSLQRVADRVVFLGDGVVLSQGTLQEVRSNQHPLIQDYFAVASYSGNV